MGGDCATQGGSLLHRLALVLRGWTGYFRPGVSKAAFDYLRGFPGVGCCCGCAASTAARTGSGSAAATCPGGGRRTGMRPCSTPAR